MAYWEGPEALAGPREAGTARKKGKELGDGIRQGQVNHPVGCMLTVSKLVKEQAGPEIPPHS